MYDTTTTKNIIKIKEQKRKEELSLITNLTVFAPTAYNNSRYHHRTTICARSLQVDSKKVLSCRKRKTNEHKRL